MKRNDSIVAKAWTRDLSSIPALAMRLAERCRTISMPFLSAPRVQASNHRLLERPLPGNLRLGGQRLLGAGQRPCGTLCDRLAAPTAVRVGIGQTHPEGAKRGQSACVDGRRRWTLASPL